MNMKFRPSAFASSSRASGLALLLAVASLEGPLSYRASAFESRFSVDPTQNLEQLGQSGEIHVNVQHPGALYYADASAVLKGVDLAKLKSASSDFADYATMGMPYLNECEMMGSDPAAPSDTLYIWNSMSAFGLVAKYYLQVHLVTAVDAAGGSGNEWQLVPKLPEWQYDDNGLFSTNSGSWFMEPLPNGEVYVRYYLQGTISSGIPDSIIQHFVKLQFGDGATKVIQILRQAAN